MHKKFPLDTNNSSVIFISSSIRFFRQLCKIQASVHWTSACKAATNWQNIYCFLELIYDKTAVRMGTNDDNPFLYYRHNVLQLSSGIDEPGSMNWKLALSLLVAWIMVYFCIWKGIRTTGKLRIKKLSCCYYHVPFF